ncbi:hypothetical protein BGW80DRAFT_1372398 [Lactifluus volemus]|nr:hypothetical protein BGW80DRAFT_1372398 [Lactifluus volemus]
MIYHVVVEYNSSVPCYVLTSVLIINQQISFVLACSLYLIYATPTYYLYSEQMTLTPERL